ncbi:Bro-N domain-containing protein [Rhodoferax sp.]|uniref:BRO-N domain-containing protein n=1 Tax=Rhodoferax sp. TaxID=50421 RepID=UPI0025E092DB|nr:Bro-N domain-containing protein [Rhodoferax sp.]
MFQLSLSLAESSAVPALHFIREGQAHALRTSIGPDGQHWFVVKDACAALGLSNAYRSLLALSPEEKGSTQLSTPGGVQTFVTVNQSGLYAMALQSRKPAAVEFRKWVTGHVLPAIQRDGVYVRGEERLLQATSPEEAQAQAQVLAEVAAQGLAAKYERTREDTLEERDGQRSAWKIMSRNRKPHKKPKATSRAASKKAGTR